MHTILKNTSGVRRSFSFIPPHGRELDDNQEVEILGELIPQMRSQRAIVAYEDAIRAGEITIVNTPPIIIQDDVTGLSKQVVLASGSLDVDDQRLDSL